MMTMQQNELLPLVSVIMPTHNCGAFISDSIQSVLNQTYENWELLVVDDGSTDETPEILRDVSMRDSRVRVIQIPQSGAARARNAAIDAAKGEYLAFLDSDDLWRTEKLEKQISYMRENNINFSCTAYGQIDEQGKSLGRIVVPFARSGYWRCLYYGNCIGNSTAVYRIGKAGKVYVPEIEKRNDFALWLKILRHDECVIGLPDVLADYRIRSESLSSDKRGLIRYQWELYRKVEKLPLYHCVLAMLFLFARKALRSNIRKEQ